MLPFVFLVGCGVAREQLGHTRVAGMKGECAVLCCVVLCSLYKQRSAAV